MAELRIHQSNRLERLSDLLAELCRRPIGSPFEPERIVVPNPGMARWLSLRLADRLGVCANVEFPLPSSFAWEVWRAVLHDVPEEPAFPAPVLAWRIFTLLEHVDDEPAFRPLASYLDGADDLRRFELAEHVAEVFDQYLVYRPEMILAWEEHQVFHPPETRDERWQAELWRRLMGDAPPRHRARLGIEMERVSRRRLAEAHLPARVMVFGIPALTRTHLATLRRLAEVADVHLFVVNPCRAFWEDILPPSDIARLAGDTDPAELFLESGNPLLASMGRQGRDFISLLELADATGTESFEEPAADGELPRVLDVLQGDILDLRTRDGSTADLEPVEVAPDDDSIQIHACHSPMREVEVLHDRLLDLFRRRPDLEPAQVRVMTPDIETYAPLIDSVFGTATGRRRIPYAIADRQPRAERSTVAAFLSLLELSEGRFDAATLLSLLETEAVRTKFDLEEGDLPRVAGWIRSSGIRWGIDAAHRARLDLPALPENTWRFGLDRLMLGHAMSGRGSRMFDGVLPVDDVEGAEARLMGHLHGFAEAVFEVTASLAAERRMSEWQASLDETIGRFFATNLVEDDIETIRAATRRLTDESVRGGCDAPVSLRLVHRGLDRLLRQPGGAWAFLSGSVTFCTMVPMRNVPAEVVCLLGMNDDSYPRSRRPPGFDLVPRHPQKGDRSRRDDDRYLFLEALLSARQTLYVSYVGRSIRDNTDVPPSILVSELTDVIAASCRSEGAPVGVATSHPLQGFSPRYFDGGSPLFSYARELCEAAESARATSGRLATAPAFLTGELPALEDEWRTVRLDALLRFFRDPTKYLLKARLGISLDESDALIESSEPFRLEPLSRYQVRQQLMELALSHHDPADLMPLLRASGALPHGLVGERAFEELRVDVESVARRLEPLLPTERLPPATIDERLEGWRVLGALAGLTEGGILDWGFGPPNGRDQIDLWIRHLTLNLIAPAGVERRSRRVSQDGVLQLAPVTDARDRLADLLALYEEGLRRPLPLFPDESLKVLTRNLETVRLDRVAPSWKPYPRLAFRDLGPDDEEFRALARRVFEPIQGATEPA